MEVLSLPVVGRWSPRVARHAVAAVAVAWGACTGVSVAWAQAPAATAAPAPAETVRAEVGKPFMAAQELLRNKQLNEALAKLQEADAVASKTPYETYVIERLRAVAALSQPDLVVSATAFEAAFAKMAATGKSSVAEQQQFASTLTGLHYRAKQYAKAAEWARKAVKDGSADAQTRSLLASSLYLSGDYAGAGAEIQAEIKADEAAGKQPTEERLQLLGSCWVQLKDNVNYVAVLEKMVAYYPKPAYWVDLVSQMGRKPTFSDRLWIDALRLEQQVGALISAAEVMDLAQSALDSNSPIEARKVVEQGYASGVLGAGAEADAHKRLRDTAAKKAADEEKSLAQGVGPSAAAKSGVAHVHTGLNLVFAGRVDKGLAMMEQGIAKGNFKYSDEAYLRMGLAYVLAGQKDKAVQAFKQVQGNDGGADLARLWLIHLKG